MHGRAGMGWSGERVPTEVLIEAAHQGWLLGPRMTAMFGKHV